LRLTAAVLVMGSPILETAALFACDHPWLNIKTSLFVLCSDVPRNSIDHWHPGLTVNLISPENIFFGQRTCHRVLVPGNGDSGCDFQAQSRMFAGKCDEIGRGKRLGEVVSLSIITAETGQLGKLQIVLHAFGDDPHIH